MQLAAGTALQQQQPATRQLQACRANPLRAHTASLSTGSRSNRRVQHQARRGLAAQVAASGDPSSVKERR
jgi:hypothetical protein